MTDIRPYTITAANALLAACEGAEKPLDAYLGYLVGIDETAATVADVAERLEAVREAIKKARGNT